MAKEKQDAISFQKYKEIIEDDFSKKDIGADEYCKETIALTLGLLRERPLNFSIYRVPSQLRKVNEDAYIPRIVSIGPFHHRREDLLKMEEHKWRYMLSLLKRTSDPQNTLDLCVEAINKLQEEIVGCYAEDINMTWKKLSAILVVDGCFILEVLVSYSEKSLGQNRNEIIGVGWMIPTIKHDLALLENQIPFSVLQQLFKVIESSSDKPFPYSLTMYVLLFFQFDLDSCKVKEVLKSGSLNQSRHLLEILHILCYPSSVMTNSEVGDTWGFKDCATQLLEAGIRIEKAKTTDLRDITFSEGVIKLPALSIDETLESIIRNLIVFEPCSTADGDLITSYVMLIRSLIRSPKDAKLLQEKGIIKNSPTSGEDVSNFFDKMCRDIFLKKFYFAKMCEDVNEYSQSIMVALSQN